jgi:hypothetical protein
LWQALWLIEHAEEAARLDKALDLACAGDDGVERRPVLYQLRWMLAL